MGSMKKEEYRKWRGCTRKVKYSKAGAERVAAQLQDGNSDTLRPIEAYKCGYCGRYHVGHRAPVVEEEVVDGERPNVVE